MITKGTRVRVRTTNGGDAICTLFQNYVPTYDLVAVLPGALTGFTVIISAMRIASVEAVPCG